METLPRTAEQLQLRLSVGAVCRAEELKRRVVARGPHTLLGGIVLTADPRLVDILCLHIACERSLEVFVPTTTAAKGAGLKIGPYMMLHRRLMEQLPSREEASRPTNSNKQDLQQSARGSKLPKLMIQFGCTQMQPQFDKIMDCFREKYSMSLSSGARSSVNWLSDDIITAVFFSVCAAIKIGIPKHRRDAEGASSKLAAKYMEFIKDHCAEELKSLNPSLSKPLQRISTPTRSAALANRSPAASTSKHSPAAPTSKRIMAEMNIDTNQVVSSPQKVRKIEDASEACVQPLAQATPRQLSRLSNTPTKPFKVASPAIAKKVHPPAAHRPTGINNLVCTQHHACNYQHCISMSKRHA
ncbi:hypothetical protein BASA50_006779 [Batrachochytrium salamandrivorans]|uniref:ORC6 second cyclin-like domain-containing protein n=1 Tax=Batrachochytrium salamandrivorans TaxID=1357716 RepID=A0ABQ8FCB8_9FUNG|nr:hypothetical protein BASA62_001415 [Batrachochytrium salamandrivorans]KAH6580173.1 hypothetical protein BASA60_002990 [Batrachochytrium salamandrivorans]KAH6594308.1 hypothetical protein BASA50_006779 [Batrachochytrium salamandrivorans]KAJ1338879.1 hypothetical protein BSLG_006516 [Batrachochytrium salamandrivorans]